MYLRWRLSNFCLFEQGYFYGCEVFEYVDWRGSIEGVFDNVMTGVDESSRLVVYICVF